MGASDKKSRPERVPETRIGCLIGSPTALVNDSLPFRFHFFVESHPQIVTPNQPARCTAPRAARGGPAYVAVGPPDRLASAWRTGNGLVDVTVNCGDRTKKILSQREPSPSRTPP